MIRFAAFGAALLLLCAATADARRMPTRAERTAIMREFDRQSFYDAYGADCVAFAIRVSTVNPRWAAVSIRGTRRSCSVQGGVESFHRPSLRGQRWRSHQLGNGGGCNMPSGVRADLRLACY